MNQQDLAYRIRSNGQNRRAIWSPRNCCAMARFVGCSSQLAENRPEQKAETGMTHHDGGSDSFLTRRGVLGALAATTVATAAPTYANAFGFLRRAGNVRRVRMYSGRTGESIDVIYWVDGRYIDEAVREISWFMRDWRQNKAISIDKRTVDILAQSHALLDVVRPYLGTSGMLGRRNDDGWSVFSFSFADPPK